MKARMLLVASAFSLLGCQAAMYGTAADLNKLSVGMQKSDVIAAIGNPNSTAAYPGGEYLIYRKMAAVISDWPKEYFVKIESGKVVAYGQRGDFDSTKPASTDVNIRQQVQTRDETPPRALSDYERLDQLHKLRLSGALTEDEYQQQKQRLLK